MKQTITQNCSLTSKVYNIIKWTQKGSLIKLGDRYLKIVKIFFGSYLTINKESE
jgi:hypothetical protein